MEEESTAHLLVRMSASMISIGLLLVALGLLVLPAGWPNDAVDQDDTTTTCEAVLFSGERDEDAGECGLIRDRRLGWSIVLAAGSGLLALGVVRWGGQPAATTPASDES